MTRLEGIKEERRADRPHRGRTHRSVRAPRHQGRGQGPSEAALFHLAQDGAELDRLRAALRHLRLSRSRRDGRRLLRCGRRRPHDLAERAGALQGLHFDAQAERLPLDPHDRDRPGQPARRTADPHPRDARDRRIRHRRPRALQGRRHASRRDGGRESRAYRGLRQTIEALASDEFRKVPRAHQARTVSGPGVLLHPQGAADRVAARGDRDRFRLRRPYRRRQLRGRRENQRPHRAADLRAHNGDEVQICAPRARAARRLGQHRGDRPRPRRDPPRDARGGQGAIWRPRAPDRRARLRARGKNSPKPS